MKLLLNYLFYLDAPKYDVDLKPLEFDLPYEEVVKHYREKNKFLFEMTNEEIELNNKLKSFNELNDNDNPEFFQNSNKILNTNNTNDNKKEEDKTDMENYDIYMEEGS